MSVPGIGYVIHNKARVALERALKNRRQRVTGVDWESKFTLGLYDPETESLWPIWSGVNRR